MMNYTTAIPLTVQVLTAGNTTTTCPQANSSAATTETLFRNVRIASIVVYTLLFFIGSVGNCLVLVVFGRRCIKLKTCEPHYMYLVSLALCDLVASLIIPVEKLFYLLDGEYEMIGVAGCACIHFITVLTFTVSPLTLTAISVQRYIMIKWPFRPHTSRKMTLFILLAIWTVGCFTGVPVLMDGFVVLSAIGGDNRMVCSQNMTNADRIALTMSTFSVQVAVPLLVMATSYLLIVFQLFKLQRENLREKLFDNRKTEQAERQVRDKKMIKLLVVIVSVFFLCVAPANIFYLLYLFESLPCMPDHVTYIIYNVLIFLQMSNNCANPIIYSKLHKSFRTHTRHILCSCCNLAGVGARRFAVRRPTASWSREASGENVELRRVYRYSQVGAGGQTRTTSITVKAQGKLFFKRANKYRQIANV